MTKAPVRLAPILNRFINPERLFHTTSVQTKTGLTNSSKLSACQFGSLYFLDVSLVQIIFRLSVNLDLEPDC